jgi:hypothetical protein
MILWGLEIKSSFYLFYYYTDYQVLHSTNLDYILSTLC